MAKLSAPNPNIFTTDPIEQVFAKGVTNRDNTAGLNASWLLAFGNDRADNQDKYLGALGSANKMDAQLAQQEMGMKLREQGMKSATDLIKEGFMPSTLRAGGDLFPDPASGDVVAKMLQDLIKSKVAANYNKGAGGGAGKESTTVQQTYFPNGGSAGATPGPYVLTSKGPNAETAVKSGQVAADKLRAFYVSNPQLIGKLNASQEQRALMMLSNKTQPGIED